MLMLPHRIAEETEEREALLAHTTTTTNTKHNKNTETGALLQPVTVARRFWSMHRQHALQRERTDSDVARALEMQAVARGVVLVTVLLLICALFLWKKKTS
jgi:hypothetical protein